MQQRFNAAIVVSIQNDECTVMSTHEKRVRKQGT